MSEIKLDASGLVTPSIALGNNVLTSEYDKLIWNGEEIKGSGGHNVGEQWISMDGTIPFGGLAFLGQTVSKETYIELYNWVEANGRFKTEAEWQSLYTANNGNVSFYAKVDDTSFRLPSFKGYLKANETGGGYTKEGLPNITGYFSKRRDNNAGTLSTSGAFSYTTGTQENSHYFGNCNTSYGHTVSFNASKSNSIYGASSHVTPETNTILIGVYAFNTILNNANVEVDTIRQRVDELETLSKHAVGEQWISMDGTIPAGGVPFNGQILNIADYQALYNWAKDNSRVKTESEWQTLKTNNNSNVAYYSDYSSTQFRMPLFRGYLKADSASGYIKQGLPDHTHTITSGSDITNEARGNTSTGGMDTVSNYNASSGYNFSSSKASVSNSIYGNSSNVTPETSKIVVGVYAFNTVVNAAILDATSKITSHIFASDSLSSLAIGYPYSDASGALISLRSVNDTNNPASFELFAKNATTQKVLTGKPDGTLTWDGKPIVRLVASWKSGTSWYRKYSDGWIEQGGYVTTSSNTEQTINLHTAFSNTNYFLVKQLGFNGFYGNGINGQYTSVWGLTTSSFKTYGYTTTGVNAFRWYACGY